MEKYTVEETVYYKKVNKNNEDDITWIRCKVGSIEDNKMTVEYEKKKVKYTRRCRTSYR